MPNHCLCRQQFFLSRGTLRHPQASCEMSSLQCVLGLPQDLILVGHAQLLLMWRSSSDSILSPSWMAKLLTLSLGERSVTLWRKLISACFYLQSHLFCQYPELVTIGEGGTQNDCFTVRSAFLQSPNLSISRFPHEQDHDICMNSSTWANNLCSLRLRTMAPRFGGTNFHSHNFTFGCDPLQ